MNTGYFLSEVGVLCHLCETSAGVLWCSKNGLQQRRWYPRGGSKWARGCMGGAHRMVEGMRGLAQKCAHAKGLRASPEVPQTHPHAHPKGHKSLPPSLAPPGQSFLHFWVRSRRTHHDEEQDVPQRMIKARFLPAIFDTPTAGG